MDSRLLFVSICCHVPRPASTSRLYDLYVVVIVIVVVVVVVVIIVVVVVVVKRIVWLDIDLRAALRRS